MHAMNRKDVCMKGIRRNEAEYIIADVRTKKILRTKEEKQTKQNASLQR